MPQVRFTGTTDKGELRHFDRTGGCFCVIGKRTGYCETIVTMMQYRNITTLKTLTWLDIKGHNEGSVEAFRFIYNQFDFMRTCLTTPEEFEQMEGQKTVTFDIENYQLNEVMHAIFHIRSLVQHSGTATGEPLCTKFKSYCQEMPEHYAYALTMMPHYHYFYFDDVSRVDNFQSNANGARYGSDENVYLYGYMDFNRFLDICAGKFQREKFEGGVAQEMYERGESYIQNISVFGNNVKGGSSPKLPNTFRRVYIGCRKQSKISKYTPRFVSPSSSDSYELDVSKFKSAFDEEARKAGIPTLEERLNA